MTAVDEVDEEERHVPTSGGNYASGSGNAVDASQGAGAAASTMQREPATTFPRDQMPAEKLLRGERHPHDDTTSAQDSSLKRQSTMRSHDPGPHPRR